MKKTIKRILLVIIIMLIIVIGVTILIIKNKNTKKDLDIIEANNMLTNYYSTEGLQEVLDIPLMSFGVLDEYANNAFLMTNFDPITYNVKEIEYDPLFVLFIGNLDKDTSKICLENMEGYLSGMKHLYENNKRVSKLLNKAVIESDTNYVYLVIGKNSKLVSEELQRLREN